MASHARACKPYLGTDKPYLGTDKPYLGTDKPCPNVPVGLR